MVMPLPSTVLWEVFTKFFVQLGELEGRKDYGNGYLTISSPVGDMRLNVINSLVQTFEPKFNATVPAPPPFREDDITESVDRFVSSMLIIASQNDVDIEWKKNNKTKNLTGIKIPSRNMREIIHVLKKEALILHYWASGLPEQLRNQISDPNLIALSHAGNYPLDCGENSNARLTSAKTYICTAINSHPKIMVGDIFDFSNFYRPSHLIEGLIDIVCRDDIKIEYEGETVSLIAETQQNMGTNIIAPTNGNGRLYTPPPANPTIENLNKKPAPVSPAPIKLPKETQPAPHLATPTSPNPSPTSPGSPISPPAATTTVTPKPKPSAVLDPAKDDDSSAPTIDLIADRRRELEAKKLEYKKIQEYIQESENQIAELEAQQAEVKEKEQHAVALQKIIESLAQNLEEKTNEINQHDSILTHLKQKVADTEHKLRDLIKERQTIFQQLENHKKQLETLAMT